MTKQSEETQLAVITTNVEYLRTSIDELKADVKLWKNDFVTKTEFKPVRMLTYGGAGIILTTAVLGLVSLIWR